MSAGIGLTTETLLVVFELDSASSADGQRFVQFDEGFLTLLAGVSQVLGKGASILVSPVFGLWLSHL